MKRFIPILILFFFTIISSCNKDEIDKLEKRNIELQEQISNLTIEINSLTSDLSNLSSSNNDLLNQITNLQYIINELEEDLNNMTNDYEQAESENSDLYDEFLIAAKLVEINGKEFFSPIFNRRKYIIDESKEIVITAKRKDVTKNNNDSINVTAKILKIKRGIDGND